MKRIVCLLLTLVFLILSFSACSIRGNTSILDTYNAESLVATYEAILSGDHTVSYPVNETVPNLNTFLVDSKEYFSNVVTFYLYNQSDFFIQVKGYAWLIQPIDDDLHGYKLLYYNAEKHVSNASYKIRIDPACNAYFPFESLDRQIGTPDTNALLFFFFRYEDTDYVGCANAYRDRDFICWPVSETISETAPYISSAQ